MLCGPGSRLLNGSIPRLEQSPQVALENENVREPAKPAERRFIVEAIHHTCRCAVFHRKKEMVVVHPAKRSGDLRIAKMPRWIERRDADGQALPDEKMRSLPSYFLIGADQAAAHARYYFFLVCDIERTCKSTFRARSKQVCTGAGISVSISIMGMQDYTYNYWYTLNYESLTTFLRKNTRCKSL